MDEDWITNLPRQKEKAMMATKLYEFKYNGETLYGNKLAVNSSGQWVMEVKGTGTVIAVDKADVTEVLPYSVSVQFETGKTIYSYLAEPGAFEAGAFYLADTAYGRSILQVTDVDTKSPKATTTLKVLAKIKTE